MTEATLPDWPRPRRTPGGKDAFLFYVVYGRVDTTRDFSVSRYRFAGISAGLDAMAYGPTAHPEVVASFREGILWNELTASKPHLAREIAAQESCLILRGHVADPPTLNYLRDAIGFLAWCLDGGG